MESSSDDSFLWTDASNDSSINMPKKSNKQELDANAVHSSTLPESLTENEIGKLHKSTKKRKQQSPDSTNYFHAEEKQIKLEPESDLEVNKKKARKKDSTLKDDEPNNTFSDDAMYLNKKVKEEQASIASEVVKPKKKKKHKKSVSEELNDMDWSSVSENMKGINNYLDMKVKEEQVSFIPSEQVNFKKKKKCKISNSNIENSNAQSVEEENSNEMESHLNLRVKEEQASEIKLDQLKSKKKKKQQSSVSDTEDKPKSLLLNSAIEGNDMSACSEQSDVEYSIIDEKFSAEETIVQNPKKKKHEKNTTNYSAICDTRQDHGTDGDISLLPDFSCNNIVSSTIINTSIESKSKIHNQESNSISQDNLLQHENNLQRITKISDRFRFEDDENSSQEPVTTKLSPKVDDFLRVNSNFQVTSQTQKCLVTDDDEIWILRCPLELDHIKLKDMKLLLDGKCKIKINGQTFDGIPSEGQNRLTLLTNHHGCLSVNNFPVQGSITYRKRIPKTHIPQNVNMINNQTHFIPLPETKCRHPLFGTKYKKAMKIPAEIAKRLEDARIRQVDDCENSVKRKKKKQRKKSMDIKEEEKLSPEPETSRKKRKRKLSQDNDIPHKKRKQMKHDPDSAEVWESEKAIEENLFNF